MGSLTLHSKQPLLSDSAMPFAKASEVTGQRTVQKVGGGEWDSTPAWLPIATKKPVAALGNGDLSDS